MSIYTRALASWRSWRAEKPYRAARRKLIKAAPEIAALAAREHRQRANHGRTADTHKRLVDALHARLRQEMGVQ